MYKDPAAPNGSLRKEVRSYELILTLRRKIGWVVGACILSFIFTYWYSQSYFLYRSRVIVDVSPAPVFLNNPDRSSQPVDVFRTNEYVMRILQFVHSNKMTDHLIQKFDLYTRYGINPGTKYAYDYVGMRLNYILEVKKSPFENVIITVSDPDRDFAAVMADEVASYTDVLAREYFSSVLKGKLIYYNEIIAALDQNFAQKTDSLNATLALIRDLKKSSSGEDELKERLSHAENALIVNTEQMSETLTRLGDMKKSEQWILTLMSNKEVKFVSVMQKAIPDTTNFFKMKLLLGLAAAFAVSWLSVLFIYFVKTYRQYFSLFFSR